MNLLYGCTNIPSFLSKIKNHLDVPAEFSNAQSIPTRAAITQRNGSHQPCRNPWGSRAIGADQWIAKTLMN